jgi:hypothetical protein
MELLLLLIALTQTQPSPAHAQPSDTNQEPVRAPRTTSTDTIYVAVPPPPTATITPLQLITGAVAVYGALLATLTFYSQRRATRPAIHATLGIGFTPLLTGAVQTVLTFEAVDRGERTPFLRQPHILLPDSLQLIFPFKLQGTTDFPCELKGGQGCTAVIPLGTVLRALREKGYDGTVRIRAAFRDQTGPDYKTRPFKLDLAELEKSIADE